MPLHLRFCLLSLCFMVAFATSTRGQAPPWQTAVALEQNAGETSSAYLVKADGAGNLIVAGSFTGIVRLGGTLLTSAGGDDIFVAKWNLANRSFLWAVRAGGSGSDYPQAIALMGGSIYLTGAFSSSLCGFGSITLANAGTNTQDIFVAKMADTGPSSSFVWAQRAGGSSGLDVTNGIGISGPNIYVAGLCTGPALFGTTSLAGGGFVAKLIDAGSSASFSWAQSLGLLVLPNALAMSGTSVYLAGNFASPTAVFGATTLTNAGGNDVFVTKLLDAGTSGTYAWATRAGGPGIEAGFGVAVSGTDVYVAGSFTSAACVFGGSTLRSAGGQDAYVAKLTDAGTTGLFVWGQRLGGTRNDYASSLAVQGAAIYMAGSFDSPTADAGPTTLLNAGTGYDIFLAHLTDTGLSASITWAQRAGGAGNDNAGSCSVSGTGVYVGGSVVPPASFGSLAVASASASVGYIAALTDAAALASATPLEETGLRLFPNPAHSVTQLLVPPATVGRTGTLTLTDVLGRVVRKELISALPSTVSLLVSDLPRGLYAVRLVVQDRTLTQRVLLY